MLPVDGADDVPRVEPLQTAAEGVPHAGRRGMGHQDSSMKIIHKFETGWRSSSLAKRNLICAFGQAIVYTLLCRPSEEAVNPTCTMQSG